VSALTSASSRHCGRATLSFIVVFPAAPHDPQPRTGRVALPPRAGRAPHWPVL